MLRPLGNRWRVELTVAIAAFILSAFVGISGPILAAELSGASPAAAGPTPGESRVISGPGIDAGAGTLPGALVLAYQTNPQINAQRAATRAADENVPTALAGYRPRVAGSSSLTELYLDNTR